MTKNVCLIGDSICGGYREIVKRELSGEATLWTPDKNGCTSGNVLKNINDWVLSRRPDVVHFNCGLHDLKRRRGKIVVPVDEYSENMGAICKALSELDGCVAIWAATTPVNEAWHHENKGSDRLEKDVELYNRRALEVVRAYGFPVNDLFTLVNERGRNKLLRSDGVHFEEEGCEILGMQVAEVIRGLL
jgi:lysophospholipase L1-like esterase